MNVQFRTTHRLSFLVAPWVISPEFAFVKELLNDIEGDWLEFKVGSCVGQWRATELFYEILIRNNIRLYWNRLRKKH